MTSLTSSAVRIGASVLLRLDGLYGPRDAQRDVHLAEMAPQALSMSSLCSGEGSEIAQHYGNWRAVKDALQPSHC
jgi:hypothetical protein